MRIPRILVMLLAAGLACSSGQAIARSGGGFGGGGGFKGGGFSAPSRSFTAPSVPHVTAPTSPAPSRGFSAPAPQPVERAAPPAMRPAFDAEAQRARRQEDSTRAYREAHPDPSPPRPTQSTTPASGSSGASSPWWRRDEPTRPAAPAPQTTTYPRERVIVREESSITSNPFFWMWLMQSNNQSQRDEWVYHNRDRISTEQMEELRRKDADIDRRLREMESRGVTRDPGKKIDGVDETAHGPPSTPAPTAESGGHGWLMVGLVLMFLALVYFVFIHRFPTRRTA